jgi:predicted transcriptional regulator
MLKRKKEHLSKREQQLMDIIYMHGVLSAGDIHAKLPDPPSYSAVRAMLKLLVDKDILSIQQEGNKYLYSPNISRDQAKKSALSDLLSTFFDGSAENAVATLINMQKEDMDADQFDRLQALIRQAKEEGK